MPTGNFGDILAGICQCMGLPVGRLVCASNANDVLTEFISTGRYDRRRPFYKTTSPSMDILVSSNLERLLFLLSRDPAYVAELMRSGIAAVDPGQMEAGRSLGLNYMTTMVVIVIPQAIRAVLPALGNEFIVLLKDTSLITTIGGKELLYAAQGIMNRTYEAMFPLLGVALIYLILVMLFTWLLSKFERRLAQSDR